MRLIFILLSFLILYVPIYAQKDPELQKIKANIEGFILNDAYREAAQEAQQYKERAQGLGTEELLALYPLLCRIYNGLSDYEGAVQAGLEGRALAKKTLGENSEPYLQISRELGEVYLSYVVLDEAEALHREILAAREALQGSESVEYARALIDLASTLGYQKDAEGSYALSKQAKTIFEANNAQSDRFYALAILLIGIFHDEIQEKEEAMRFYEQARDLLAKHSSKKDLYYLIASYNLAASYSSLGQNKKAEKQYLSVLAAYEEKYGKNHPEYMFASTGLASFYSGIKKYEEAKTLLFALISYWNKQNYSKDNLQYIFFLESLARVFQLEKNYEQAIAYHKEALLRNKNTFGANNSHTYTTLLSLASLYLDMAEPQKAEELMQEILDGLWQGKAPNDARFRLEELPNQGGFSLLDFAAKLSRLSRLQQRPSEEHQELLESILRLYSKLQSQRYSESSKLGLAASLQPLLEEAIQTARSLDKEEEAFFLAEKNKSILLSQTFQGQRAKTLGELPDSIALAELRLREELEELKKAELEAVDAQEKEQLRKELNSSAIAFRQFEEMLKKDYPRYHKLKYSDFDIQLADIQRQLPDSSLFIEYYLGDTVLFVFALDKKGLQSFRLDMPAKRFKQLVRDLRKNLSNYKAIVTDPEKAYSDYCRAAYNAYQGFLEPVLEGRTDIAELILVADEALGHLPFEAFLRREVKEQLPYNELPYLFKDYRISYNYSARLWLELRTRKKNSNNGKLLAFAAEYQGEDALLDTESRSPQLQQLRTLLQPLPQARREVEALSKLYQGQFYFDQDAHEGKFKAEAASYSIIHLAMHGLLHPQSPMLSALAFTEWEQSGEDDMLQAWEISRLNLQADMLVLSACETGYGSFVQGEGVMSLARSFMYAGLPSVIMSLWQVNDASTSLLMQAFYKNIAAGMNKSEALQAARLSYLDKAQGFAGHPAYWAAFVCLGDTQPLVLKEAGSLGGSSFLWLSLAAFALLALLFFARSRRS